MDRAVRMDRAVHQTQRADEHCATWAEGACSWPGDNVHEELTPLDIWIVSLRAGKNHRKGHDLRYEYLSWSDADSSRAFAAHR